MTARRARPGWTSAVGAAVDAHEGRKNGSPSWWPASGSWSATGRTGRPGGGACPGPQAQRRHRGAAGAGDRLPGLLGSLAGLVTVEPGAEAAWPPRWVGWPRVSRCLRRRTPIGAELLRPTPAARRNRDRLRWASQRGSEADAAGRRALGDDLVTVPERLRASIHASLAGWSWWRSGGRARRGGPTGRRAALVRAVTAKATCSAPGGRGGSTRIRADRGAGAVERRRETSERLDTKLERLRARWTAPAPTEAARLADVEAAQEAQSAADARRAAVAQRLGRADQGCARAAEAERLRQQRDDVGGQPDRGAGRAGRGRAALEAAQGEHGREEPTTSSGRRPPNNWPPSGRGDGSPAAFAPRRSGPGRSPVGRVARRQARSEREAGQGRPVPGRPGSAARPIAEASGPLERSPGAHRSCR